MPKICNKYYQKRNIGASVPISTFMCLRANYIFPRWVCRFCWRKYVDRSWEYIYRSQTHECGNWGRGRAIPRKGIYKRDSRCSADLSHLIMYPDPDQDPAFSSVAFKMPTKIRLQRQQVVKKRPKIFFACLCPDQDSEPDLSGCSHPLCMAALFSLFEREL
jgi:hypothetical protein